jgi:hypothetical protein
MALNTATGLKTAIADWLADNSLTAYLDDFVTLAEDHLNRELRHRKMQEVVDLTPSSGVCTLPSDYLYFVRVVEKAAIRRELQAIAMHAADQLYPARQSGLASHFTVVGDELRMFPVSSNDIELTYMQRIPSLNANSTNWLLSEAPGLYLSACQLMALVFKNEVDTPRAQALTQQVRQHIDRLNAQSDLSAFYKVKRIARGVTP